MIKIHYIEKEYNIPPYRSKALDLYFGDMRFGVLDIETTGLSPVHTKFILGGLLSINPDGNSQRLEQFFAQTPDEEEEILLAYLEAIKPLDVVLTFNGKHFDIPFLQKRADALGIQVEKWPYNLDLYLVLNGHSQLRKLLPNLKQKTVETFMGLWTQREDEISGAESVELYQRYVRNPDKELLETILLHNSDDVLLLYQLLPILSRADFHKAMYTFGFPLQKAARYNLFDDRPSLVVSSVQMSGNNLRILGKQMDNQKDYASFASTDKPYTLSFDSKKGEFEASFPLHKRSGLSFLDLRSFEGKFSSLEKYPTFESNFLIIKNKDAINYMELNHFVKLFLETISEVI